MQQNHATLGHLLDGSKESIGIKATCLGIKVWIFLDATNPSSIVENVVMVAPSRIREVYLFD